MSGSNSISLFLWLKWYRVLGIINWLSLVAKQWRKTDSSGCLLGVFALRWTVDPRSQTLSPALLWRYVTHSFKVSPTRMLILHLLLSLFLYKLLFYYVVKVSFLQFLLILLEFHARYFGHIHPPPQSLPHPPPLPYPHNFMFSLSLYFHLPHPPFSPFLQVKSSLCWLTVLGYGACSGMWPIEQMWLH